MEFNIESYIDTFKDHSEPVAKSLWVSDSLSMKRHTRGDHELLTQLIDKYHPSETQEVKKYRLANIRAVTKDSFTQAITNLQRTLSHSNVAVVFPEDIAGYLNDANFKGKDLISFFESDIVRSMIEMANGLLVWWPENVGDTTRSVKMVPIVVNPERIVHYDENVLTFLSDEKSEVLYNGKTQWIGEVYYCITKEGLHKRVQIGKKTENKFEWLIDYYPNPTKMIYALILGGDNTSAMVGDEDIAYKSSFFSSAIPFADEAFNRFSDYQGVTVSCAYPLRETEAIECNAPNCVKGKVRDTGNSCSTCNGTGLLPMNPSPYGVIIRGKANSVTGETPSSNPVVRFIHPDIGILDHMNKSWKEFLDLTQDALNLLFIDEAQSGIAKEVDREDKIATLDKIGRHLYTYLIRNSVKILYKFMVPTASEDYWPPVSINLPYTFVPKTTQELIDELKSLKEQNSSPLLIGEKQRELLSKMFGNDPKILRVNDIISILDPYYLKTDTEKAQMGATGLISIEEAKKSALLPQVVTEYARMNPDFLDLDTNTIVEAIRTQITDLIGQSN